MDTVGHLFLIFQSQICKIQHSKHKNFYFFSWRFHSLFIQFNIWKWIDSPDLRERVKNDFFFAYWPQIFTCRIFPLMIMPKIFVVFPGLRYHPGPGIRGHPAPNHWAREGCRWGWAQAVAKFYVDTLFLRGCFFAAYLPLPHPFVPSQMQFLS